MHKTDYIQSKIDLEKKSIENILKLLQEDCTIPFIARYRKDATNNADELKIESVQKYSTLYDTIAKRKQTIIETIKEQDLLTEALLTKINQSYDLAELEDIYIPYKKKRKTRADIAKNHGLEPLAKMIMAQNIEDNHIIQKFVKDEIPSIENALQGARDIIAEWINENTYIRKNLRNKYKRQATISTKVIKGKEEEAEKYHQYFDWSEPLAKTPSHRLLAMIRATNEGMIKTDININKDEAIQFIEQTIIKKPQHHTAQHITKAITDAYKRLIAPSLSNDVLQEYKLKADLQSIGVFSDNLSQLLLAAPLGEKRVMGIDPGYKTGCKIVCLDENGNLLYNETIYPHAPQKETSMAIKKVRSMANSYKIQAIAIGNGTASRETEQFIKKITFDNPIQVYVVNEAGASVYSASKIAREEFPNYDVTVRGAVSIGRRLQDPLAELVKIEPKSIGVGQYQHDVEQTLLKEALHHTVEKCVNTVGINLNTASKSLLSFVSGIGEKTAENIVKYRKEYGAFDNREDLKNVPRLGEKTFQQAAAFVRIVGAENPLDNSAVHPEAYPLVEKIAKDKNISVAKLIGNEEIINLIDPKNYITPQFGIHYITDLLKELKKPGLDPRKNAKILEFDKNLKTIDDVEIGKIYPGIVNNITNFGCFVDIGIKESGLVHISQLKEGYISDVNSVVKIHQHIEVKVIEVDKQKKRLQLSMIL